MRARLNKRVFGQNYPFIFALGLIRVFLLARASDFRGNKDHLWPLLIKSTFDLMAHIRTWVN